MKKQAKKPAKKQVAKKQAAKKAAKKQAKKQAAKKPAKKQAAKQAAKKQASNFRDCFERLAIYCSERDIVCQINPYVKGYGMAWVYIDEDMGVDSFEVQDKIRQFFWALRGNTYTRPVAVVGPREGVRYDIETDPIKDGENAYKPMGWRKLTKLSSQFLSFVGPGGFFEQLSDSYVVFGFRIEIYYSLEVTPANTW